MRRRSLTSINIQLNQQHKMRVMWRFNIHTAERFWEFRSKWIIILLSIFLTLGDETIRFIELEFIEILRSAKRYQKSIKLHRENVQSLFSNRSFIIYRKIEFSAIFRLQCIETQKFFIHEILHLSFGTIAIDEKNECKRKNKRISNLQPNRAHFRWNDFRFRCSKHTPTDSDFIVHGKCSPINIAFEKALAHTYTHTATDTHCVRVILIWN